MAGEGTREERLWVDARALSQAARAVQQARDALTTLEAGILAQTARTLSETAEALQRGAVSLARKRPATWLTPEEAAEYLRLEASLRHVHHKISNNQLT